MRSAILLFFLCCICTNPLQAQVNNTGSSTAPVKNIQADSIVRISSITIYGNKKTRTHIILREIQFKTGDSIRFSDLNENLKKAHNQVYNTTLFSDVSIKPEFITPTEVKIYVVVKEKWYLYPTPQFQLVDRNFNDWVKTYNADLNRVIYGAKFAHYNFSGHRDVLRVYLLNGYARNISASYTLPFSNRALTEGFSVGASFTQNREVPVATNFQNKLLQYKNENGFVRNVFGISGGYLVRKGLFRRHSYNASYTLMNVSDSVLSVLPDQNYYYGSAKAHKGYVDLVYAFQYSNTNNVNYPLSGSIYGGSLLKRGFEFNGGANMLMLDAYYYKYLHHGHGWYSSFQAIGKAKAPFKQPYINRRALGYGDFTLRGLEYYVIDGVAASIGKYTLKKRVTSFSIPVPFRNRIASRIPFTIFAKTYGDAGYSYSEPEFRAYFNNRLLYSGGFGIDILTLYDINLKIEYSVNQLNEKGVFLQLRGGF